MADLRRQGLTFEEVGARVGCSERTARRKVGHVEPHIELPQSRPEPERDPDALRERLARAFAAILRAEWDRWPSTRFVAEANRQLQERLETLDPQTLFVLAMDTRLRSRLFLEIVGPLYRDLASAAWVHEQLGLSGVEPPAFEWRPPRERQDEDERGFDR